MDVWFPCGPLQATVGRAQGVVIVITFCSSSLYSSLLFEYRELQKRVLVWLVSSEEWEGYTTSFELQQKEAEHWVKSDQWVGGSWPFFGSGMVVQRLQHHHPMNGSCQLFTKFEIIHHKCSTPLWSFSSHLHRVSTRPRTRTLRDERLRYIWVSSATTSKHQNVSVASY
jgi:hypothetical protein